MKNLILVFLALIVSSLAKATTVPDAVKRAFQQKFPTAKKIKWEKENTNEFEASFMLDKKEVSAVYNSEGGLKEIETEISTSELPQAVKDAFNNKYSNVKILEVEKIEMISTNSLLFEIEVKINKKKTDLLFDEKGNETK